MFFQNKIDRAFNRTKGKNGESDDENKKTPPVELEKHDFLAMVISAFIIIVPIALIVLLIISLAGYLFLT